jgi:FixJ family two-component response regulator
LAGFAVYTYPSGEAFLQSLRASVPGCVILDLQMPGVSGFDVQTRLAESRVDVPVIAITGHHSRDARQRALSGGAMSYFTRPVSEEVLLQAIGACLGSTADAIADASSSPVEERSRQDER